MKRLYISIIMLAAVISGGIASVVYIEHADDRIQYLGAQIREEYSRGEDVTDDVAKLCRFWEEHYLVMCFIDNSNDISPISAEISRLPELAKQRSEDLIPQVDCVCYLSGKLNDKQFPYIHSVL